MSYPRAVSRMIFCGLVFVAVYPLVTGLSYLMQSAAENWAIWQRHLVAVPIIVLSMVFVIIPHIQGLLARLDRRNSKPSPTNCPRRL
jgi:antibiotic biosynthesis monooxygenase (ABM) superfamily enzyme